MASSPLTMKASLFCFFGQELNNMSEPLPIKNLPRLKVNENPDNTPKMKSFGI